MPNGAVFHSWVTRLYGSLKGRFFYGWWIVTLGSIIFGVGGGILYYGFTVFFLPLKRDFGVSSAAISLLFSASRLEGGIDGPIIGHLIDKFGPRIIMIVGITMSGIGLILLSTVHDFWSFFGSTFFLSLWDITQGFFTPSAQQSTAGLSVIVALASPVSLPHPASEE